jgi:hypothetical protein
MSRFSRRWVCALSVSVRGRTSELMLSKGARALIAGMRETVIVLAVAFLIGVVLGA